MEVLGKLEKSYRPFKFQRALGRRPVTVRRAEALHHQHVCTSSSAAVSRREPSGNWREFDVSIVIVVAHCMHCALPHVFRVYFFFQFSWSSRSRDVFQCRRSRQALSESCEEDRVSSTRRSWIPRDRNAFEFKFFLLFWCGECARVPPTVCARRFHDGGKYEPSNDLLRRPRTLAMADHELQQGNSSKKEPRLKEERTILTGRKHTWTGAHVNTHLKNKRQQAARRNETTLSCSWLE